MSPTVVVTTATDRLRDGGAAENRPMSSGGGQMMMAAVMSGGVPMEAPGSRTVAGRVGQSGKHLGSQMTGKATDGGIP